VAEAPKNAPKENNFAVKIALRAVLRNRLLDRFRFNNLIEPIRGPSSAAYQRATACFPY
jgi:hypothetical protein